MRKNLLTVFLLCTVLFCSNAAVFTISFGSYYYSPNNLTVSVGDTITWNGSFSSHPLASSSVPSGALPFSNGAGSTFSYQVTVAGNYNYYCQNHSSMTGIIVALNTSGIDNLNELTSAPLIISEEDFIHIVSPNQTHSVYAVEVVSLLGSLVYSGEMKFASQDLYIDKRSLLPGVYFIRVVAGKETYGKRIVIAR